MVISQTAEYALRAVTCLAAQYGQPQTTQQIAQGARMPVGYLSKVLQSLGKAGLVQSYRGLHGGFVLARPPEQLTLFEIVQAVEPMQRIRQCPLELKAHDHKLCPLHQRLDDAMQMVEKAFMDTTVASLLRHGGPVKPMCEVAVESV